MLYQNDVKFIQRWAWPKHKCVYREISKYDITWSHLFCNLSLSTCLSICLSDHHHGSGVWWRSGDRCRLSHHHRVKKSWAWLCRWLIILFEVNTLLNPFVCLSVHLRAYIANRVTDKLTPIHDRIFCCRSVNLPRPSPPHWVWGKNEFSSFISKSSDMSGSARWGK